MTVKFKYDTESSKPFELCLTYNYRKIVPMHRILNNKQVIDGDLNCYMSDTNNNVVLRFFGPSKRLYYDINFDFTLKNIS